MRVRVVPGRVSIVALAAGALVALAALVAGIRVAVVQTTAIIGLAAFCAVAVWDGCSSFRRWRRGSPTISRRLPAGLEIGVKREVQLIVHVTGSDLWHCAIHDAADSTLLVEGLPARATLSRDTRTEITYSVTPTSRGNVTFAPAELRVRSRWGLWELLDRAGPTDLRRVYPDFGQVARYAWLAGDRRLQEIGVKTYQLRGQGTDFKQLSEYRIGDSVRHIDWRATLRLDKPIIREFQDERDQCVLLLIDCGRRMRADDRQGGIGTTHFDQVLNAAILLSYVALKQGDAVGAMTFGSSRGEERAVPPRKGLRTLDALMAQLCTAQPTPSHTDYLAAAHEVLRTRRKRALVVMLTNFRDEDAAELALALRLLRSRHLTLVASLRERIVGELIEQPLVTADAPIDVAGAHLYEQSRRDALRRLAARDALIVDAEPDRLGVALVNRYHEVKRAGLM